MQALRLFLQGGQLCNTEKNFNSDNGLPAAARKLIRNAKPVTPAKRDVDIKLGPAKSRAPRSSHQNTMALSSNTLTHFTKQKDALFGILENNFKIFFCKEAVFLGNKSQNFYCPMVSFCDIPMSEIKDHIKKYGSYGIGLTKEWALKSGLNPVLYIAPNSALSRSYKTAMNHFVFHPDKSGKDATHEELALLDILRYMKNYEGPLERKGESIKDYRFSDEREWRYVPDFANEEEMLVPKKIYEAKPDEYSNVHIDHRLKFEPNDIKYIIIKDDSEIRDIISHLRQVNGKNYTFDQIERLTTRILTTEQIMGDF